MRRLTCLLLVTLSAVASAQPAANPSAQQEQANAQLNQYFRRLTKEITDRALADVKTLDDWQKQRPELRRQLFEMLGLWPLPEKTPLHATITGTVDGGDFVVEKLHFQSRPGLYVTANFYRPKQVDKPLPTILYACGHSNVKIDGIPYGAKAAYQHHPAWFARNGYCCLILDTLQLGEIEGEHHGTYKNNKWWWISRGYTPAGVESWNCIRALDYLETRPEVDRTKIGMTGRSGGGAYTWWTTALDDRVACAVPVAGITDLENHVCDGCIEGHCDCMFMINTYQWDFATVAALAAPRPLLIANTDKDNIFPLNGVYRIHDKVKRIYNLHKAGDKLGFLITEGPHKDTQDLQVPAFRWFNRWLMNKDEPITKVAEKLFDPKQLKVFDKLPEDELNTTVDQWFVPMAKDPLMPKTLAEWETLRQQYAKTLQEKVFHNWPVESGVPQVKSTAQVKTDKTQVTMLTTVGEDGVARPIHLIGPNPASAKAIKVMPVDMHGFAAVHQVLAGPPRLASDGMLRPSKELEAWLQRQLADESTLVALVLIRGTGPDEAAGSPQKEIHRLRRFVLTGRTQHDGNVLDVLRALRALRNWAPKEVRDYHLAGFGATFQTAAFVAALDKSLVSVALFEPGLSPESRDEAFLNSARTMPLSTVIALAFPAKVSLACVDRAAWDFTERVAGLYPNHPFVATPGLGMVTVEIATAVGDVTLELDGIHAPRTVWNFLHYVERGLYDGGQFHRTVTPTNQPDKPTKIQVVQGGIDPKRSQEEWPAIALERTSRTGLKHVDGTLSMARAGPDTATSDFFICIGDQPELDLGGKRNPDGQGFAAFGRVTKGMDVVKKIQQAPADGQKLTPPVKIIRIRRK